MLIQIDLLRFHAFHSILNTHLISFNTLCVSALVAKTLLRRCHTRHGIGNAEASWSCRRDDLTRLTERNTRWNARRKFFPSEIFRQKRHADTRPLRSPRWEECHGPKHPNDRAPGGPQLVQWILPWRNENDSNKNLQSKHALTLNRNLLCHHFLILAPVFFCLHSRLKGKNVDLT